MDDRLSPRSTLPAVAASTTARADVVIVGGGAVGVSAAYHLAAAGAGRVLLLERESALGIGSTGRCAGGFRLQFSSEINVRLSIASLPLIVGFTEMHGLPLDVSQDGYLFLIRDDVTWSAYRAAAAMQRALGVPVELLTAADVADLVPGLATDEVVGATYCPRDGIADPSGLTLGYATAARRAGAEIRTGVQVSSIESDGGRVTGVLTSAGPIAAPIVVNAAGPWAAQLAATADVRLPVEPLPRHILVTGEFDGVPVRRTLVVDTATGFYFHREGAGVLMGMPARNERTTFEARVDDAYVADELLPTALRVLPSLEHARIVSRWVGLYEMTPDRHPIIGPVPGLDGLILANGFSGHGFQHAPIVGKLLAELIVDGRATTVDIARLDLGRFARGAPIQESHVV